MHYLSKNNNRKTKINRDLFIDLACHCSFPGNNAKIFAFRNLNSLDKTAIMIILFSQVLCYAFAKTL